MERLDKTIKELGLTNYRVARDLQVRESTVRSWRTGVAMPRKHHLDALAHYLNVHPAWLLYGEKHYAPTAEDHAGRIVQKIADYGKKHPEELKKIEQMIDVLVGDTEGLESYTDRKEKEKKGRRKQTA